MELGSHGHLHALQAIAEDRIWQARQREAEQLVVALDAGAFGEAIVLVGVYRLLIDAVRLGEGVIVGAGEALQGRGGVLEMVSGEGVLAPAQTTVLAKHGRGRRDVVAPTRRTSRRQRPSAGRTPWAPWAFAAGPRGP